MPLPYLHLSRARPRPLTPDELLLAADLRRDVETLALDIGPRGTFAPDRYLLALEFLAAALTRAGFEVKRHPVETTTMTCFNLEATLKGTHTPDRILVVGAHYDSIEDCPAANDNATGVAGVLAIARALALNPRRSTIRFLLFANEEPPYFNMNAMGSQIYARACRASADNIRGMVCLETIGCYSLAPGSQRWPHPALRLFLPTVGNFIAFVGQSSSRAFIRRAARSFKRQRRFPLLAAALPAKFQHVLWSDHRGFNEAGYPAFMVTDTAFLRYNHYHRPTDTPDKLDFNSTAQVVSTLINMITNLADDI